MTIATTRFRTWAPHAARVAVVGDFNDWRDGENMLVREPDGFWSVAVPGVSAGDEYLFVIDNARGDDFNPGTQGLRRVDPRARATRGSGGNGIVVDVAGEIVAAGLDADRFRAPAESDWLIYQAHVGSFVGGGDMVDTGSTGTATFTQFVHKLDYIRSLGFNAIALLPVQQNPGDGNEGYGPSHLFAPESSFGAPLDLRRLVRAAHDRGLAVLFDVVWNHFSDIDNTLWEFDGMTRDGGIYFEGGERSPWGPRLALWKREVSGLIVDNALSWFAEYRVDGLRIDAADEMPGEVLAAVVRAIRTSSAPDQTPFLIAEWGGSGDGWHAAVDTIGFDRVWSLSDPYHLRLALDDDNSPESRTAALMELIDLSHPGARVRYLLGSHDDVHDNQAGERGRRHLIEMVGGRDRADARAKARLGWTLCIALPGTPMCFMGTEVYQPGYWHPRTDTNALHGDHRFDWTLVDSYPGHEMRKLVETANALRRNHAALRSDEIRVVHIDAVNGVAAFLRPGSNPMLVVVNVSGGNWPDESYGVQVPDEVARWTTVFDSQAAEFGGLGLAHGETHNVAGRVGVTLAPWCVVVMQAN